MNDKTVLICTVGGSHQPIVRAIEDLRPSRICFICSADDPATGNKGSYIQITGRGNVIRARHGDEKPTLPNIPSQVGMSADGFEVIEVSPDDFDDIYGKAGRWLEAHLSGSGRMVADYTGGTKTMSAALVAAALDHERVALHLVTGSRSNLLRVDDGHEQSIPASVEETRFHRRFRQALLPWGAYAYDQAERLLDAMKPPSRPLSRGEYQRARDLSRAFARWDRFDHAGAKGIIEHYRPKLGADHGPLLSALDRLTGEHPSREPMRLFDLWRNAERRAAQGRYDDAVARIYRLLEWSAQWLLREKQIDTSDVPAEKIPEGITLTENRNGRRQAGLYSAWVLAAHHCGGEVTAFWTDNHKAMLDHLQARNHSILAHGFQPLQKTAWQHFARWAEDRLLPFLLAQAGRPEYRVKSLPPQLPDRFEGKA